jgi:hypothetical protein
MGHSSPFVSSCTRRQWARRRSGRSRRSWIWMPIPLTLGMVVVAVGVVAFLAGHGAL